MTKKHLVYTLTDAAGATRTWESVSRQLDAEAAKGVSLVKLDLMLGDQHVEDFEITGDVFRALVQEAEFDVMGEDIQSCGIEAAVRAQVDWFENHYKHDECDGEEWTDNWSCGVDDACPCCGADISPHDSIQLTGLDDESPAGYVSYGSQAMPAEAVTFDRPTARAA